jgi:hypothetical protein
VYASLVDDVIVEVLKLVLEAQGTPSLSLIKGKGLALRYYTATQVSEGASEGVDKRVEERAGKEKGREGKGREEERREGETERWEGGRDGYRNVVGFSTFLFSFIYILFINPSISIVEIFSRHVFFFLPFLIIFILSYLSFLSSTSLQAIEYIIPSVELRVRDPATGQLLPDHAALRYPIFIIIIFIYHYLLII